MLYKHSLTIATFAVTTLLIGGAIPMTPHSAFAHKHDNNNNYSYSSTQYSSCCSNDGQLNYNNGYNDGYQTAQTNWNSGQYSVESGGYNVCPDGHSKSYCNGYSDGYAQLWANWTYNQAHGLNLVSSQDQSSSVNVKGNNNNVTVNQGQASNSGNSDGSSNSYVSNYGLRGGGN